MRITNINLFMVLGVNCRRRRLTTCRGTWKVRWKYDVTRRLSLHGNDGPSAAATIIMIYVAETSLANCWFDAKQKPSARTSILSVPTRHACYRCLNWDDRCPLHGNVRACVVLNALVVFFRRGTGTGSLQTRVFRPQVNVIIILRDNDRWPQNAHLQIYPVDWRL